MPNHVSLPPDGAVVEGGQSHATAAGGIVIVIGSGFGGLAAAIRLQAAGFSVTLLEKRDKPGGRAYVYQDKGFTFDAGPTVITAPECLEEIFTAAGRRMSDYVEMLPVKPFYRLFWEDGFVFDYDNDLEKTKKQIAAVSPYDVKGYEQFLEYTKDVFDEVYAKSAHIPFLDLWSVIRVAPQLARWGAHRSVYNTVTRFVRDSHLRQAFSFHSLLVGGNPFTTSSIYAYIPYLERSRGVYFPKGGTGALVRSLVKLFRELGGTLQLGAEVERITTENGRVTGVKMINGQTLTADAIVSNADVTHTYSKLLKEEPLVKRRAKKIEKMSYGMSLFLIYFGTRKRYPNLAHHNVLFGPRYKELLEDIFDYGVRPDDFSLYLHAPTVTDPALAPEGCESFYVLAPVAHKGLLDIDWKKEAPVLADKILSYLDERYMPGLKRNLVTKIIFTPDDFERELNAHLGAAFSVEPVLTQYAFFRPHNRDDKLKGLYIVGAGTHPGAGVPGVVNSAKATVSLVIEDFASLRTHR